MIFASGLGIVLSLVFGCLLLALVAELYYLLWWKKLRITNSTLVDSNSHSKELFYLFCWNNNTSGSNNNNNNNIPSNPTSAGISTRRREPTPANPETQDSDLGSSKEFLLRTMGSDQDSIVEAELMRLHNRFLFTIKEETKEDLESEDGRSRKGSRTRSLSDLILTIDTPLPSPPLTNGTATTNCYIHHGFNPLFESSSVFETEISKFRTSPPPAFKFLRDAEEKMYRRLIEEAEKMKNLRVMEEGEGKDGSLIRVIVEKMNNHHSSSSQVLPLPSSPSLDMSLVCE